MVDQLLTTAQEYFQEKVEEALAHCKVSTYPLVRQYLVQLLQFYMNSEHLFAKDSESGRQKIETRAEMWLKAANAQMPEKSDLLKKLGDTSLYISGFFGDSLKRKLVDLDYYVEIGGSAYSTLATLTEEDTYARVYEEFSGRFVAFVDVLTYISQQAMVQSNKDLLRLYDRYIATGSDLAREQLIEQGLLTHQDLFKRVNN